MQEKVQGLAIDLVGFIHLQEMSMPSRSYERRISFVRCVQVETSIRDPLRRESFLVG